MMYEDTQRFRHSNLWILLAIALIPLISAVAVASRPFIAYIAAAVILLGLALLYYARLTVKVEEGILSIRFFPIHFLSPREISLDEVESFGAEEYSPIKEFGGWGWRWFPFRSKTAYSVSGNQAVRLELEDGTEIVIGTDKPEELEEAISEAK